jgi:hypothetical protein
MSKTSCNGPAANLKRFKLQTAAAVLGKSHAWIFEALA